MCVHCRYQKLNHLKMSSRSILPWFVVSMMILLVTCDATVIYVKPDKPLNISQPCPVTCMSLYDAILSSELLSYNITLKLQPGTYFIGQDIMLWGIINISIIGDMQGTDVVLNCTESVLISFVNCFNVTIKNILFTNCGSTLDTTSYMYTDIGENYWYNFPLVPQAALIFVHCFLTTLENLVILRSPGFGVIGVNLLGNTRVQSVTIKYSGSHSCIFDKTDAPLAGGIFLLFQNTPSSLLNYSISILTISNSNFSSSCSLIDFDKHNTDQLTDITGSGIFTIFGQNLYSLNMAIENNTFDNNTASYHPGLYFIYYTGVSGTNISINNCYFTNNYADSRGDSLQGIVAINYATLIKSFYLIPGASFQQLPSTLHNTNKVSITNCVFANNTSIESSGISFLSAGEDNTMNVYLKNIYFTKNMGHTASALMFLQRELFAFPTTFQVIIEDCTFYNNSLSIPDEFYTDEQVNYFRYASVVVFHNIRHANFIGNCSFKNNRGSNILLHTGVISLNGTFEFIENYAINGAGLAIYGYSYILFHEGTNVSFINNTAKSRGGAIYVEEVYGIPSSLAVICFFQYLSPRGNLDEIIGSIDVHMYFANNSAGDAGNSIFSSQINRCSWVTNTAFKEVLPHYVTDRTVTFANPDR